MKASVFVGVRILFFILVTAGYSKSAISYEVNTHENISIESAQRSILYSNDNILYDIDIDFNSYKMSIDDTSNKYDISQIIGKGADFEDTDEPYPRPVNHFYDPVNDQGLLYRFRPPLPSDLIFKSPDWALEDNIIIPIQEYSLRRAQNYFYAALSKENQEAREENFAKLFRSIGQVIHHIQDMAQPQHVRNDAHCDNKCKEYEKYGLFEPSIFEKYTTEKNNVLPQFYSGYQPVNFSKAREYWHTEDGKGIADYTNSNFITEETNFRSDRAGFNYSTVGYDSPVPTNESAFVRIEDVFPDLAEQGISGQMRFISTEVTDKLTGITDTNPHASTLSLFDQDLTQNNYCVQYALELDPKTKKEYTYDTCRVTTYNHINVAATYRYLIPRAIAYSTGLINYFFRGRLEISDSKKVIDADGNQTLSITVRNISGEGNIFSGGNFYLFYDADDGARKELSLILGSGPASVTNGGEHTLLADYPDDADANKKNPFMIIYSGKIGQEDGIAGIAYGFERVYIGNHEQNRDDVLGHIDIYNNVGEYYESRSSGTFQYNTGHLTVYDNDIYTTGITRFRDPTIFKNGSYLASLIASGDGFITSNDNSLYVTTNDHPVDYYTRVSRYDYDGNLEKIVNLNEWGSHQIAANNHGFIAAFWDSAKIYGVEGDILSDVSLYVDYVASVSSTKERFYILNYGPDYADLRIFDRNGSYVGAVPLPHGGNYLAISQEYLYMAAWNYRERTSSLIVYDRDVLRNESGGVADEMYEHIATYTIPNAYFSGVSVNVEPGE